MSERHPASPQRHPWLSGAIMAVIPVLLYAYLTRFNTTLRLADMIAWGRYPSAAVWFLFYTLCLATFLLMLLLLRSWRVYLFLGVCSLSILTNLIFTSIAGKRIDPNDIAWLLDQKAGLANVYSEFVQAFVLQGASVLGGMVLLLAWRTAAVQKSRVQPLLSHHRRWRLRAVIAFLTLHLACLFLRPDYLAGEVNVPLLAVVSFFDPEPDPGVASGPPPVPTNLQKVVLIVDESVRADYFDRLVKDSLNALPALDYGEAAATANCSAGSNALLRWGIDQNRVGSADYDPRSAPHIWTYAKRAGFRTILIDGQARAGNPQNYLGPKERQLIDEKLFINNGPDTDIDIARYLRSRFRTHAKEFIYVVKRGVHFPFDFTYPKGLLQEQATKLDRYEAGIRYSTNGFFRELADSIDYSQIFEIYTSDHGVVLEEGRVPHCSQFPVWNEFSVPLMVVTGSEEIKRRLSESLHEVRNHASHEQIFPTMLYAMGYALPTNAPRYAPPLYSRSDRYTVLKGSVPVSRILSRKGIMFDVLDHFPYRPIQP